MKTERFLAVTLTLLLASGCTMFRDDGPTADEEVVAEDPLGPVIEPELERRDVQRARIDTENWEVNATAGFLNVEDFGTEPVYGGRMGYHVTEDIYLEGEYVQSQVSDTSFRQIGAPLFENEDEDLKSYSLSVGYHMLPGEVFLGSRWARASATYMTFGVGNTEFVGEDNVTYIVGFGIRTLVSDWFTVRLESRDRIFESDLLGENEWKHNFEITLSVGAFF